MSDWANSPIFTTIIGAVIGAVASGVLSHFFGLKRDEKIKKLEESNKELKKKNKALEIKQKEDSEGIRAEIKRLLEEQEKRVRSEERLKNANQICSIYEKDAKKYYEENEKSKIKFDN